MSTCGVKAIQACHQLRFQHHELLNMRVILTLLLVLHQQATIVRGQAPALVGCPGRAFATASAGDTFWLQSNPDQAAYGTNLTCEWLINSTTDSVIILDFDTFDTECGFDFVYVYDDDGFDPNTVLVAQSGNTLPASVVAYSGHMHIILFSDANYVRSGLVANVTVTTCSSSACSAHGTCQASSNTCLCDAGWGGWDCSIELCPNDCGSSSSHGQCSSEDSHCICDENRAGNDCSVSSTSDNTWYTLRSTTSSASLPWEIARAGHTSTTINSTHVWNLGGYNLGNRLVADGVIINLDNLAINPLPVANPIKGRFWHTAVFVERNEEILVFGGVIPNNISTSSGQHTNELWGLGTATLAYTNRTSSDSPPTIASHTASMVSSDTMVVLGGTIDTSGHFSQHVWELNTSSYAWKSVVPSGKQVQVSGHTATYHAGTGLIYVIGGFSPATNGYNYRTTSLFTYNPTTRYWGERSPDNAAVMYRE